MRVVCLFRRPTRFVHVTEHINEIVAMIASIQANHLAYTVNGSVYFDVRAQLERSSHARLMPSRLQAVWDNAAPTSPSEAADYGEQNSDKRNWCDFALWKRADDNDPNAWRKWLKLIEMKQTWFKNDFKTIVIDYI